MLELERISKQYEGKPLICDLSLRVEDGETVCLLGASGSGKSTLLRIVAGVEAPEAGDVRWNGRSILGDPIHRRQFGLMFQDYALFPHLTVFENVAFGLRLQKQSDEVINRKVAEALDQVGMRAFEKRAVTDLSGGEQQRVALARTLAPGPRLLMLDEPLAALDRGLRGQLLAEIRTILKNTGIPAIYVTHDQEEAYQIADRVMLLVDGRIVQSGTPAEVYGHPVNLITAAFLGLKNTLPGRVTDLNPLQVQTDLGPFLAFSNMDVRVGQPVTLLLRRARLASLTETGNLFTGRVRDASFQEDGYLVRIEAGSSHFSFALATYQPGLDQVQLKVEPEQIQVYVEEVHAENHCS
jgi:spermidine/putrescine transport system ATP-binding protein